MCTLKSKYDGMRIFKAQISRSFSLLYCSRLIVLNWMSLETKYIHHLVCMFVCKIAPPRYTDQNLYSVFPQCISGVQSDSIWGELGGNAIKNSSILWASPRTFW